MNRDLLIRNAMRALAGLSLVAFLGWIALLDPRLLLAALVFAGGAFAFLHWDQLRHPVDRDAGAGTAQGDRVMEGSEPAVSPGVSAGGIHLTFETRTRWPRRR